MIYILSGNDNKKKSIYLKKLYKDNQPIFFSGRNIKKEILLEYGNSVSLFGETPVIIVENLIKEGQVDLSQEELLFLKDSKTIIIWNEEKILAPDIKKYKNFSTIEDFKNEKVKQNTKINIFGISDAYSFRDKIKTWFLYRDAINKGSSPEEISGILFWKIKTMILSGGTKFFSKEELIASSSILVSLYHNSHKGECDFVVGLEQFILSSLSK